MKTLSSLLHRIASWKTLLLFLALYFLFVALILKNTEAHINSLAGKSIGIIDLTMGFDPQRTLDMVAGYGDAARGHYAMVEMTADVAYPIVYAFVLAIMLTLLFRNTKYARVHLLPFLVLLFDYAENINIVYLLKTYPEQSLAAATLCEVFKLLKWGTSGLVCLTILAGIILKLARKT